MMEVVTSGERAGGGQHPFQRHNVQEWSRLDELTGMLEHARVETDHWAASTSNSSHHFGKVVDLRSRNLADGGQEKRQQTKQLEVFQTNIPGGSLQVIRSQSVTSTSSSWQGHNNKVSNSRWLTSSSDVPAVLSRQNKEFDNLKLALNPLDLSSQKTKASVGRSGSIGSRRPPSRPRSIVSLKSENTLTEDRETNGLSELSRINQQVHQEAKEKLFGNLEPLSTHRFISNGLKNENDQDENDSNDLSSEDLKNSLCKSSSESTVSHRSLSRKKSCSSEDLHTHNEDVEAKGESESERNEWNRSSRVRRSLQFPLKQSVINKEAPVIPLTKSVSQIKEEIEARKQIVSSSLRGNQWNNLGELEGVLGVVSNGHDGDAILPQTPTKKRQSFITVESLQEVRGRLRKLSSPTDEVTQEETDDGIDTEVKTDSPKLDKMEEIPKNSVKSYVFGMEAVLRNGKQAINGTGSLESRSSNKSNGSGSSRSEEWYNRRKSYGFEQVNGQSTQNMSIEKGKVDSSTDSGICRSSETMTFPSWTKPTSVEKTTSGEGKVKTFHNILIKHSENDENKDVKTKSEIESVVPAGRKTVVTLGGGGYTQPSWAWNSDTQSNNEIKETVAKGKIAETIRKLREKTSPTRKISEPITISIPVQQPTTQVTDPAVLLLKQTKETEQSETAPKNQITSYSNLLYGHNNETDNNEKNSDVTNKQPNRIKSISSWFDSELKRHSIAVDEAKYMNRSKPHSFYKDDKKIGLTNSTKDVTNTTNHVFINYNDDVNRYNTDSDHEMNAHEKKHKKVEFCKTEVHFAAEPGRFNIVETDGKPPPSNMYRRRRKTTGETPNRSGLPEIRFGDSQYEKNLLAGNEHIEFDSESKIKPLTFRGSPASQEDKEEHVSSAVYLSDSSQDEQKTEPLIYSEDETPRPRSILKNNIPKPLPFLLGENNDESLWGVKLKSVHNVEKVDHPPIDEVSEETKETEFQKLLKSLRPAPHKTPDVEQEPSSRAADNGLEVRISSSTMLPDQRRASWSVADRIRHVEDLRTKGYLTKVTFGVGEAVVVDSDTRNDQRQHGEDKHTTKWYHKDQHLSSDITLPTTSHRVTAFAPKVHHIQGGTEISNSPKVTSISLKYENPTNEPIRTHSPLNKTTDEIVGNVELSENGTRIWSFSKTNSPVEIKSNERQVIQKEDSKIISKLENKEMNDAMARPRDLFNRKSQSPIRDVTLGQNMKYETNRHRSLSPNRTQKKHNEDYVEKTSQTEPEYVNIKKDVKATQTYYRQVSNVHNYKNTKVKKDVRPESKVCDFKRKERKLSTSSSGRDGWLNTPKEPQVRHKSEVLKKVEGKKESNTVSKSTNPKRSNGTESPIYQNREIFKKRDDRSETESAILEELTKAADQILLAVNGYTDDDSFRGSSDDEYRKKHGREKIVSKPLCTISETPNKRVSNYRRATHVTAQRSVKVEQKERVTSRPRLGLGKTSSNSSMESAVEVRPLIKPEDRNRRRAARLLQRANSRELLLQTAASSSEDIGSGSETGNVRVKQRMVRRTRTQGTRSSTSTQPTVVSHRSTTSASESRTRDRIQRANPNNDKSTSKKQVISRRTRGDEKLQNHVRTNAGSTGPVKCERAERRSLVISSSVQPTNVLKQRKTYTSQSEESTKSRE